MRQAMLIQLERPDLTTLLEGRPLSVTLNGGPDLILSVHAPSMPSTPPTPSTSLPQPFRRKWTEAQKRAVLEAYTAQPRGQRTAWLIQQRISSGLLHAWRRQSRRRGKHGKS
jgi:hypothetical protein